MRPHYDFSGGVRGKYVASYREGSPTRTTFVVLIDPTVIDVFPNAQAVNEALRALAPIVRAYGRRVLARKVRSKTRATKRA